MKQPNDADRVTPGVGSSDFATRALVGGAADPGAGFLDSEPVDTPRTIALDDDWWPEDLDVVLAWRARRPRRIAVKLLGWAMLCASGWAAVRIAEEPKALDAMASWASMGQVDTLRRGSTEQRPEPRVSAPMRSRPFGASR